MNGIVFNIQKFSIHDGPGIRTTVFLKGCNNECQWCHNPESLEMQPQLQFFSERCIGCGACFQICPNQVHVLQDDKRVIFRDRCKNCGLCIDACYSGALEFAGKSMSSNEVIDEILKDKVYYESSCGGVTFSGGEPILQRDFLKELLINCKSLSLHTTVQTAGNYQWEWLSDLLPYIDLVMYDIKAYDSNIHKKYVGTDNKRILENLYMLSQSDQVIVVRTPIISSVNDSKEEINNIAKMIKDYPRLLYYELIPYHNLGISKVIQLGQEYNYEFLTPPKEKMLQLAEAAKEYLSDVRYK